MANPTDILLEMTPNGGDFILENNDLKPAYSVENLVILYLFGGNIEQDTGVENEDNARNFDWWGNKIGDNEVYNSKFERKLQEVVLNSAGLVALVNTAKEDLSPIEEFAGVEVYGSIPVSGRFQLNVEIKENEASTKRQVFIFENAKLIEFY